MQKVTEKVADFRKISAGIFPHSEGRLPPCCQRYLWMPSHIISWKKRPFVILEGDLLNLDHEKENVIWQRDFRDNFRESLSSHEKNARFFMR